MGMESCEKRGELKAKETALSMVRKSISKMALSAENRRNLFITIVSTAGCNENSPVFHMIYESILFINAPTVFSL